MENLAFWVYQLGLPPPPQGGRVVVAARERRVAQRGSELSFAVTQSNSYLLHLKDMGRLTPAVVFVCQVSATFGGGFGKSGSTRGGLCASE